MRGISRKAAGISPSPTLAVDALAKKMKSEGINVIGFGVGEPDFDTPAHIKKAAEDALEKGFTKYTAANGIEELRKAICEKLKTENSLEYSPGEVLVSCGAKHSLWNVFQTIVEEGDEVILPSPYWVSYAEQIKLCGGKPAFVETPEKSGFCLDPAAVEERVSKKTKAIVINSPNNPTGAVYGEKELAEIAELAGKNDCYVISDEVYEKMTYGKKHASIAALGAKERTIVINGFSKTYAMTGWRIGYAAGPKEVIKVMSDIQSHCTSNPTSFAQKGALAAITGPQDCVGEMAREFAKRRRVIVDGLRRIPGISCVEPEGAFYAFPNVSALYGKRTPGGTTIENSNGFAKYVLEEAKVAVVPGSAFGSDAHIRISYATSEDNIRKGLERIAEAVAKLGP
ncbi:MAG: pyridoxal phosphate-dependent aminotransferase [Candidatus Micrarchaeota archaeon]|nr:pyridoxal phosphate-dependent aminotransferase [Candidatus Micrarchaeota archaeon]